MQVIIVCKKNKNEKADPRNIVGICSSKRAAITLIVNELLEKKIIKVKDIAKYRKLLNEESQTQGLDTNFIISEITINKFLK